MLEEIKELALPLFLREGVELVDLLSCRERGRFTLRFLVDKPQGITLDDCAYLNREIIRILDQQNIVQESYVLEVSSPGLDRPLKNTRDFQRFQGELVKIVLHEPIEKENVWIGYLDQVDEENLTIRTETERILRIPREEIARANLEVRV